MKLKRAGMLTKVIIVVLLIYFTTSLLDLEGKIQDTEQEIGALQEQIEQQKIQNQQLQLAIENSDDPETLERVAREKGYVKQGETLYVDIAG